MQVLCVIPARIGSSRLPNKPLRHLANQPLIRRVVRRALEIGGFHRVVVATDDHRVVDAVSDLAEAVMTDPGHDSGTSRVAEVVKKQQFTGHVVVNLQGDEPFVTAEAVDGAVEAVGRGTGIGTVAGPLETGDLDDHDVVKVAVRGDGTAAAFGRRVAAADAWHRHVGLYAYTPGALARWTGAPPLAAERTERLEQLRPLAMGERIGVTVLDAAPPHGIDTEEQLRRAERAYTVHC